ncbi:LysR family transcriptional regulator [Lysinibacillus odysseyi]|uniref:LysR family transcriptional regulator n=1 Tax=Lysinibacillus odysseyi 34hs-1 = NBRC 100172 TaxID=1220589 RepID=A0A0A3IE55_9BACI|nr:LysR family transcriptional regulator [Lysinibacillus odysseyi]KGR81725.1 LysR family transcriptional regulator [Lysinibacillus odysseyi 34hs-1 = NBRC 100172]
MSLVKYQILQRVAEAQSFTKAARLLGLTQSAVSHAVSNMEKEFGFPLIHRSRTSVTLTADGHTMLVAMRKVLQAEEQLQQEASRINGLTKGTVRVGLISSISTKWMPTIIRLMEQEYPGIRIELREGDYYQIEQWLIAGEIDCGFLNRPSSKQFQYIPLIKDPMLCIISSDSPLYNMSQINLKDIEGEDFIMPSYKGTNDVLTIFEKYGIKPNIRFELFDDKGIITMVEHSLGITIMPKLVLGILPDNVKAVSFEQETFRIIGLSTSYNVSPAAGKFIEILQDWLRQNEENFYVM